VAGVVVVAAVAVLVVLASVDNLVADRAVVAA